MTSRLFLSLLCLSLASCATTQIDTPEPEPEVLAAAQEDLPKGEGESIDEHLYIPEPVEPATDVSSQLPAEYDNVWARLVDSFALPDCSGHRHVSISSVNIAITTMAL